MKYPALAIALIGVAVSAQSESPKAISAPDVWWASLEGKERSDFIRAHTIVQTYFMDELSLSFDEAVARIDKLTGKDKKQSIQKLAEIVEWATAQKRLSQNLQLLSESPRVWLANNESVQQVVEKLKEQEKVFREDMNATYEKEQKMREKIVKDEK